MNTFELKWIDGDLNQPEVQILIDGKNLIDSIKEFEDEFRGEISRAPAYAGLDSSYFLPETPNFVRWTGQPMRDIWEDKAVLLVCAGCREEGCWPILARIQAQGEQVIWQDFEQPHRSNAEYFKDEIDVVLDHDLFFAPHYTDEYARKNTKNVSHHDYKKECWDYSRFGPFVFDQNDYLNALQQLLSSVPESQSLSFP